MRAILSFEGSRKNGFGVKAFTDSTHCSNARLSPGRSLYINSSMTFEEETLILQTILNYY